MKLKHQKFTDYEIDYSNGKISRNGNILNRKKSGYNYIYWPDRTSQSVHRILFETICGNIDNFEIDHIDKDTLNNHPTNLRLVTHQENQWNTDNSNIYKHHNKYYVKFCSVPIELFPEMTKGQRTQCSSKGLSYEDAVILRDKIKAYFNDRLSKILTLQDIINELY